MTIIYNREKPGETMKKLDPSSHHICLLGAKDKMDTIKCCFTPFLYCLDNISFVMQE